MGIAYRCDTELGCTFIVWDDDVTPEEWSAHLDAITKDPAFPPGPLLLADLRTAGGAPSISSENVDEMASRWREHAATLGTIQCALVPNDAWDKARQLGGRLEGTALRVMVFNEPWTACSWLGLDVDAARSIIDTLRQQLRG